jgi:hypothetical protein
MVAFLWCSGLRSSVCLGVFISARAAACLHAGTQVCFKLLKMSVFIGPFRSRRASQAARQPGREAGRQAEGKPLRHSRMSRLGLGLGLGLGLTYAVTCFSKDLRPVRSL